MDLNMAYADHQRALMAAGRTSCQHERSAKLAAARSIALRISAFQKGLGADAAKAWERCPLAASPLAASFQL